MVIVQVIFTVLGFLCFYGLGEAAKGKHADPAVLLISFLLCAVVVLLAEIARRLSP